MAHDFQGALTVAIIVLSETSLAPGRPSFLAVGRPAKILGGPFYVDKPFVVSAIELFGATGEALTIAARPCKNLSMCSILILLPVLLHLESRGETRNETLCFGRRPSVRPIGHDFGGRYSHNRFAGAATAAPKPGVDDHNYDHQRCNQIGLGRAGGRETASWR